MVGLPLRSGLFRFRGYRDGEEASDEADQGRPKTSDEARLGRQERRVLAMAGSCHFEGGNPTLPGSFCCCPKCAAKRAGDGISSHDESRHASFEDLVQREVRRVLEKLLGRR